jgi:hypothetical protein
MAALSPEQSLVLAAIERFLSDPDLTDPDADDGSGDVLAAIVQCLTTVLPVEQIEQAVTGLLADDDGGLDDDTQIVLEALLGAIERDDGEAALEDLLSRQAPLIEANALEGGQLLLVWDPSGQPPLQELEILEVVERYPCRGSEGRWTCDDFVALLEARRQNWRRTLVALEVLQEHPESTPTGGTVLLVVPADPQAPLEQLELAVTLGT